MDNRKMAVVHMAVLLAADAFVAWQIMKVFNPDLARKEYEFFSRLTRKIAQTKPVELSHEQVTDFVAQITAYVRKQAEG